MELRQDPLSGDWVLIAENRAARPHDFQVTVRQKRAAACPFCRGSESDTPDALAVYPAAAPGETNASGANWQVRVVPNLYPAVRPPHPATAVTGPEVPVTGPEVPVTGPEVPVTGPEEPVGGGLSRPAVGAHEVIIEAPLHVASLTQLTDEQLDWTFVAYQDRLQALSLSPQIAYGQVFKNVGPEAGASLEHVHSQLLALPIVPPRVARKVAACRVAAERDGSCPVCRMLDRELGERRRVVAESAACVAWCPFASRFPYEIWIAPRTHADRFEDAPADVLRDTARLVRELIGRLESVLPELAYNFCIFTRPLHAGRSPVSTVRETGGMSFHWHIEILPRVTKAAGFEWATGMCINPVAPETATRRLLS
jgi:UDPglucose--hexose-1-phosphate uridylyltransferase